MHNCLQDMTRKRDILVLINPKSGTENKKNLPDMLANTIDSEKYNLTIRFTERPNHAYELSRQAVAEGIDAVIAVGGDGTVNEVASALCDSKTALGIIPDGSGNGLARHIGIPLDLQKAAEAFNESTVEAFDYCTANDRPFFCTCGIGFDAQVSSAFSRRDKRGAAGYIKSALIEYLKYRPETYSLITESGKITEKAFLIACGNASQYGNNAYITPHADMQDGLIDVTVMLPITPFDTAMLGVLLFSKHIDQNTNIITFRTPEITIERSHSGVMHLDGEAIEMPQRISIKCHPGGLNICVPPTTKTQSRNIFTSIEAEFWKFIDSVRGELNI